MQQITELTAQQKALLPEYKIKWQLSALSTEPINKQKAIQSIEAVYNKISQVKDFDIYFFDSPAAIANLSFLNRLYPNENWTNPKKLNNLIRRIKNELNRDLFGIDFWEHIQSPLIETVGRQLDIELWQYLGKELHFWSPLNVNNSIIANLKDKEKSSPIWKSAKPNQKQQLENLWSFIAHESLITTDGLCSMCCRLDFCISELQCIPEEDTWQILTDFISNCGWTFFYQDFCFSCERPSKIILDENNRPLSQSEAAIQYLDSFSIFVEQ
ncbi:MAG: hypothetical protein AAF757_08980 [Cyanobacteria bacterium P01_D01_bin.116]